MVPSTPAEAADSNARLVNTLWLVLILLLGLAFRMPHAATPFIGAQAWNEAHYTSEGHNFATSGDWAIQAGVDGVDPTHTPLLTWQIGLVTLLLGTAEWVPRILIILYSELAILVLYFLVREAYGLVSARVAAVIFATIPVAAFLGRTVQLDTMMICFCLASLYFFLRISRIPRDNYSSRSALNLIVLCGLFSGLTIAAKYTAVFLILPIAGWLFYSTMKTNLKTFATRFLPYATLTVLPTSLWLGYVTYRWSVEFWLWYVIPTPSGWLGENLLPFIGLEARRFYGYAFGLTALLGTLGLYGLMEDRFESRFLLVSGAIAALFLFAFAKNASMLDYYLFILAPFVAVSAANLITKCHEMNKPAGVFLAVLLVTVSAYTYASSPFFTLDYGTYEAGTYLSQNSNPGEMVVAGIPQIAYYADRRSIFYYSIDQKTDDEVIYLLETSNVRLAVLGQYKVDELAATRPRLLSYISENFQRVASYGTWQVWQRSV